MLKNRRSSTPSLGGSTGKQGDKKLSTASLRSLPATNNNNNNHPERSPGSGQSASISVHWSEDLRETVLVAASEDNNPSDSSTPLRLNFELLGGADQGNFPHVGRVGLGESDSVIVQSGEGLAPADVILEIQGQKVAGYTKADVEAWLRHCLRNRNPVVVRTVKQGRLFNRILSKTNKQCTSSTPSQISCLIKMSLMCTCVFIRLCAEE